LSARNFHRPDDPYNRCVPLGLYISVPFCRTKCTFCNFASDVFSRARFDAYVSRVEQDIARAAETAASMGGEFQRQVDTIYLGGGTPTVLAAEQLERIFRAVRQAFEVACDAEVTVEVAPGTLSADAKTGSSDNDILPALVRCGVNRVSLGVQSFVDQEARAVGRLHTREITLRDIERLRAAGIGNINIDLIAGLPHQTRESWKYSLDETLATGVPHVSVYMLEVDEESRLGRELIAGGTRYHAHFVPNEDLTAELYEEAIERLHAGGVEQYEISNFARLHRESRHNLKYWTREPYLGFGVDASSMLWAETDPMMLLRAVDEAGFARKDDGGGSRPCAVTAADVDAVRFTTADSLENYVAGVEPQRTFVTRTQALEEEFFLGLRLARGIDLRKIAARYGLGAVPWQVINESIKDGLLEFATDEEHLTAESRRCVRLTKRGRLLSNEVFERFIGAPATM
jgi:oxygen-independent coproporphyrinogen III oxidase